MNRWRCSTFKIGRMAFALTAWLLLWGSGGTADQPLDADPESEPAVPDVFPPLQHHPQAEAWTDAQRATYADDDEVWIGHGVKANRRAHTVTVMAEGTGLGPGTEIEFLLIAERSGHDYEAIAVSHALPSDVHYALTFIGVPPGAPYQPRQLRFFPKGERVHVHVEWTDEEGREHRWPAESLIRDLRTDAALPATGFTFVGSMRVQDGEEEIYVADRFDPQSIISVYSEPTTVLDRPEVVAQTAVYGSLEAYPERTPVYGQIVYLTLTPEFTDGRRRVRDVSLQVRAGDDDPPVALTVADLDGEPLHTGRTLADVLATFNRINEDGQTPFVQLDFDESVPLNELRDVSRLLRTFEQRGQLQIEPPLAGQLFYRAFLPVEAHRERSRRPSQALELHLHKNDEGYAAEVIQVDDQRVRREDPFNPIITRYPVESPTALADQLEAINHRLPVLLVFVPETFTYGELLQWLGPVRDSHPTVHLFLEADL